jgi:hypothetical protein
MASKMNLSCHLIEFLFIGNTWLANSSFATEPPSVSFHPTRSNQISDIKPKEEKKPIAKPVQNIVTKKPETTEFVFDNFFSSNIDIAHLNTHYLNSS